MATNAAGTMYSGRRRRMCARNSASRAAFRPLARRRFGGNEVGDKPVVARRNDRIQHRRMLAQHRLTSPSSIRKPRTFTWSSIRPTNSRLPSGSQRTRSPVR